MNVKFEKSFNCFRNYDLLIRFLQWLKIVENSWSPVAKKISVICCYAYLLISYVEITFSSYGSMIRKKFPWKISLAFIASYTTGFINILFMIKNRKYTLNLLRFGRIIDTQMLRNNPGSIRLVTSLCLPVIYSLISTMILVLDEYYERKGTYLTYFVTISDSRLRGLIVFIKIIHQETICAVFTRMITLLFCRFCDDCCVELKILTKEIKSCNPVHFTIPKQIQILKSKA